MAQKKATCHPERPHLARGLCRSCYEKAKRNGTLDGHKKAVCHPDRNHWARGMCSHCYDEWLARSNPEKCRARQQRYKERHPGRSKEASYRWRKRNPEKQAQATRNWRDNNRERVLETRRKWTNKNREILRARDSRRHARKHGVPGWATGQDRAWRALLFGNECAYCGGEYRHMDHLIALNCGGTDQAGNLVPACVRCNESKSDRDWREWYRSKPFYDKRRERFIERNTWQTHPTIA
jgi:hypothetical protein